eukprot:TRINITY_DN59657_c0_g1_i1.p1 TRINITY_DN59657_c0_g1~~TRINITY_DN59657_c0_g1_i1.p1  ORF type:complete len:581 (-),score=77.98 TRINITY_DN59657_c0_g1_i1:277-2019(-)
MCSQLWDVVGGSSTGGILVREGKETSSPQLSERLTTGAVVKELALVGQRLRFELISGEGPSSGWVSITLGGKPLLVQSDHSETSAKLNWTPATPLVPLNRPKPEQVPAEVVTTIKPFDTKNLDSILAHINQNEPGEYFHMPFPHTAAQLEEFGNDWLTRAFQAAGTLPMDNSVQRVVSVRGFAGGGAGFKADLVVEYAEPDENLHTDLFVKLLLDVTQKNRMFCIRLAQEPSELIFNRYYSKSLPFRAPKYYFGDWSSKTTNWILISEKLQFADRTTRGQRQRAFNFEAPALKGMDWVLNDTVEKYYALWRVQAMLAAYAHSGKLGEQIHKVFIKNPHAPLMFPMAERMFKPYVEQTKDFVLNVAPGFFPTDISNREYMQNLEAEVLEVHKNIHCFNDYLTANAQDAYGLFHPNLQLDNGFYWVDEQGRTDAGLLDWGGMGFSTFGNILGGNLMCADAQVRVGHLAGLANCFVSTLREFGGPRLDATYLYRHVALVDMKCIMNAMCGVESGGFGGIYEGKPKGEWTSMNNFDDPLWAVEDVPTMMTRVPVVALTEGIKTWKNAGYYRKFISWREECGKKK